MRLAIILGVFGAVFLFGMAATLASGGRAPKIFAKTEERSLDGSFYSVSEEQYPIVIPAVPENAEACGAPVAVLEDGLIIEVSEGGWNEGKGSYVVIEGLGPLSYLHLGKIFAIEGQFVRKGRIIAEAGRSGLPSGSACVRETD